MLEQGRVVERYTVERLLGEGGMAAVYRVRHTKLGTSHALKVLTYTNRSIRERLEREGQVQASLQHPNAVAVLDVLDVDGAPGLLMELVDGPDLSRWIETEDYDLAVAEEVFRGIVAALAAAHRRGVIHRDLKPANVLMARTPTGWQPKVADFGLAKAVIDGTQSVDEAPARGHTRTGVMMGTPAYMAPEQIRDAKNVDQRADLFSLGCILYELVTRRQPFVGADIVELFTSVTSGDYPPPRDVVPDLPERFVRTITACLQVEASDRPASCEAVLALLDDHTPTTSAGTVSPTPRSTTPAPVDREALARDVAHILTPSVAGRSHVPRGGAIAAMVAVPLLGIGALAVVGFVGLVGLWLWRGEGQRGDGVPTIGEILEPVTGPAYACGGQRGEVIGYTLGGNHPFFNKTKGSTWVLSSERIVYRDPPTEQNGFDPKDSGATCILPPGAKIELLAAPERVAGRGVWVPIVAESITLPESGPTEAPAAE